MNLTRTPQAPSDPARVDAVRRQLAALEEAHERLKAVLETATGEDALVAEIDLQENDLQRQVFEEWLQDRR